MLTIIGGAFVTFALSLLASRIMAERAKVWLTENKHKIKWEIIYTIFGPDPNNPPQPVPTPEVKPWFPWLPWNRKKKALLQEPEKYSHSPSRAQKWVGSLEFGICFVSASVPVGYLIWAFTGK